MRAHVAFKFLELVGESIPQFIFTVHLTAYHGIDNTLDGIFRDILISIVISFSALIYGICDSVATDFGYNNFDMKTGIVKTLKAFGFVFIEVSLMLSLGIMLTIIFGGSIMIGIFVFLWFLEMFFEWTFFERKGLEMVEHGFYSLMGLPLRFYNHRILKNSRGSYLARLSITKKRTEKKKTFYGRCGFSVFIIPRTISKIVKILIIIAITFILKNTNSIKFLKHLHKNDELEQHFNCGNICNVDFYKCNRMTITESGLTIWNYVNWILILLSCLQFIFDQIYREYVHNYHVTAQTNLTYEGNLHLIPEGGNGQFNFAKNYYEYFANKDKA